jgi:hypothetical protein
VIESEYGASIGGRRDVLGRELRGKLVVNREIDYETREGFQESREPRLARRNRTGVIRAGDLSLGELNLSDGRWDLTESEYTKQETGYLGLGLDLDAGGRHRLDGSVFYTRKWEEVVELRENGYLPNFDYGILADKQANGEEQLPQDFQDFATEGSPLRRIRQGVLDDPSRGPLWSASFLDSVSIDTERELTVGQVGGEHEPGWLEGFTLSWAGNHARTTQEEEAVGALVFFEADDLSLIPTQFPVTVAALGPGRYATNGLVLGSNQIDEDQWFGRLDAEYARDLTGFLAGEVSGGVWYEKADREVEAKFLETQTLGGSSQFAIFGETLQELGRVALDPLDRQPGETDPSGTRDSTNESKREIEAWHLGGKLTFWERVDVLGGSASRRSSSNRSTIPTPEKSTSAAPRASSRTSTCSSTASTTRRGTSSCPVLPTTTRSSASTCPSIR